MQEKTFILVLTSPGMAETAVRCDAVSFSVPNGTDGKNGGSVGIRPGHTHAMMALDRGKVVARLEGQCVLSGTTSGGFAMVEGQRVTILSDNLQIEQLDQRYSVAEDQI
ncbi:MAG: hypothetical protein E7654_06785 [Ruminococcaceae bacterium]|nr:hypothetical protein [Oscillospiraceae bacterium]